MDVQVTSEEDKRRFERLLSDYVEATDMMNVENLELWYTRIRQCILIHKKDQSRSPLFEVKTKKHLKSNLIETIVGKTKTSFYLKKRLRPTVVLRI